MSGPAREIAIIGVAGLYPGAPDVPTLWDNILAGHEAVTDAPESWNAARFHDPGAGSHDNTRTYCGRGGFIEPFAEFDPVEFGIMPNSVDGSDPGHFLCLRVAGEALADAGYLKRPFARERTGVIVGHGSYPHRGMLGSISYGIAENFCTVLRDLLPGIPAGTLRTLEERLKARLPPSTPDTCPGLVSNLLSGRIANRFNLMGPNYLVDAACASSIVALDSGIRELRDGRCDMMLVGGAQENTNAGIFTVFSMLGALSRRGKLRPFDRNADGTLLGEGIGFAVLKRLADAERDGDRIYALVKGTGLASDGQGQAFLVPRLEGEIAAMERAYAAAGVSPDTVGLVEAHGTGTVVGDRTEIQAMTRVFGVRDGRLPRCAIGSVKSMISHTIPASGMAGLIKMAFALRHKVLPPTLCDEPNPDLGLEKSALYVNTEPRPWIHGRSHPRRAAVSAFGFGGINSHAILEEYTGAGAAPALSRVWPHELAILRGEARAAVREEAIRARRLVAEHPAASLRDLAFTLHARATPAGRCLAIVAESPADLAAKLDTAIDSLAAAAPAGLCDRRGLYYEERPLAAEGRPAFLLPGEGAQYPGMLAGLCLHFDEVRSWFDRADRAFAGRGREPLPSQIVFPPPHLTPAERREAGNALWSMEYALPLLAAADTALYHLMLLFGIRPGAIAGHSTAQDLALGAAALADTLTPETILGATAVEDRVIEQWVRDLVPAARLLAVGASTPERVAALAAASGGALRVAMDNCPNQVVLCGGPEAVEQARATLEAEGALCQFLPFDRAYHTGWYRPVCDRLDTITGGYEHLVPRIPFYCTTTGQRAPADPAALRRLMIDQWAEPIRFRETIETMYADGARLFLEVGPRGNLTGFVEDILAGRDHAAIPLDLPSRGGLEQLLHALARLCAHGITPDTTPLFARRHPARLGDAPSGGRPGHAPKRRPLRLKMDIPSLSLAPEDIRDLRPAILGAPAAPTPGAAPPPPPAGGTAAEEILRSHQDTMRRILDAHQSVLRAAARGGAAP